MPQSVSESHGAFGVTVTFNCCSRGSCAAMSLYMSMCHSQMCPVSLDVTTQIYTHTHTDLLVVIETQSMRQPIKYMDDPHFAFTGYLVLVNSVFMTPSLSPHSLSILQAPSLYLFMFLP